MMDSLFLPRRRELRYHDLNVAPYLIYTEYGNSGCSFMRVAVFLIKASANDISCSIIIPFV